MGAMQFKLVEFPFARCGSTGDGRPPLPIVIMQGAAGAIAALLVSMVIGMTRPEVGFFGRWFACVLIGAAIWLSSSASNYIWYKYPQEFVLDELFCKLFEWACGGFFIAAIVRPRNKMLGY